MFGLGKKEAKELKPVIEILRLEWERQVWALGKRIGKLEHQRNEARRKHGVVKRELRQVRFVQKAALSEVARLQCELALRGKELAEARDRVASFEAAQAARLASPAETKAIVERAFAEAAASQR